MAINKLLAMEVFVRVVETGGITRAAERLGLPKATVTTLLQKLEATLGRAHRAVQPRDRAVIELEAHTGRAADR